MAPESERAICVKCGKTKDSVLHSAPIVPLEMPHEYESAAPLTCSEVVERLAYECVLPEFGKQLDREKAEAILHSWRERRVQELEGKLQWLRANLCERHFDLYTMSSGDCATCELAEWREQIRKGAKHE